MLYHLSFDRAGIDPGMFPRETDAREIPCVAATLYRMNVGDGRQFDDGRSASIGHLARTLDRGSHAMV
jgi:hypothetical protein